MKGKRFAFWTNLVYIRDLLWVYELLKIFKSHSLLIAIKEEIIKKRRQHIIDAISSCDKKVYIFFVLKPEFFKSVE